MLQVFRVRTRPIRDIFTRRNSTDESPTKRSSILQEKPVRPTFGSPTSRRTSSVKTFTVHPSTKSLELDKQHILVIQHNKGDDDISIPPTLSFNFTIQECLYTLWLIDQALPKPMPREKPVPAYYSLLDRNGWSPRPLCIFYQPTFSEILETVAKLCVDRTGGQRVASQAAFTRPAGSPKQRLTITLCGDDLDEPRTDAYLQGIWKVMQQLQELYPPYLKRNGKDVPYPNYVAYRQAEKDMLGIIVTHTMDRIKRRVMKWHNRFRGIAHQFEEMNRKSATLDIMKSFINVLTRFLKLLYGFFEPFKAIGIPPGLHPTITLILSEMYRDTMNCLREWYPWEACSPDVRDLTDYSLFTMMDNVVIQMDYSCDGFMFSKYVRKILEPVILTKKLAEVSSEWRWKSAMASEAVFKVVEASERAMDGESVDTKNLKQAREMIVRVLAKDPHVTTITTTSVHVSPDSSPSSSPTSTTPTTPTNGQEDEFGKVWKYVKTGVRPQGSSGRWPSRFHKLHAECELAERFCHLSTFDFSTVKSQAELDSIDPIPYESVAVSHPPCRACKTWFMGYLQRVRSSEEKYLYEQQLQKQEQEQTAPKKNRSLYIAYTERSMSEPVDTTEYNWIAPRLEPGLDARVKEWLSNQLRLQAVNMAGLMSSYGR
ncbi:hypothetical protein H072_9623 [Dactylellina haptotyla CBS 200.50]|uniref:Uncharacterized protein n=1 Tax=Dactylellina haptotyla (strain CBS 200.50) TaxID=1284197 RepID=S8A233_DACHA|nr:hypothetical protein H072_9623 [Dactylellina haptotyla CBS 200.50]